MSDTRARTLSRAAAAGDLQAEARLLVERVRRGELTQERLELAAYCGSEAARLVVDPGHRTGTYFFLPPTPDRPNGFHGDGVPLRHFAADLEHWGRRVEVRAACVAARLVLGLWSDADPEAARPAERVIALAEAWLRGDPHHQEARLEAWRQAWFRTELPDARWLPWVWTSTGQWDGEPEVASQIQNIVCAGEVGGEREVIGAVRESLRRWALGADA